MTDPGTRPGILASLKGLLSTSLTLLQTRLQLLSLELEEERQRVLTLLFWGGVAVMALAAGLVFAALFLTVLFWDTHRVLVLGVVSVIFISIGAGSLFLAMRLARTPSGLFSSSLAEISRDRAALRPPESQ